MQLGFLISYLRKNSVRDKVRNRFIKKETLPTGRAWAISEGESGLEICSGWLLRAGWFHGVVIRGGDYSNYLGEMVEISRKWATAHFSVFDDWHKNCQGTCGHVTWLAEGSQWVCTVTIYQGNVCVYVCIHMRWSEVKVLQSCPTLCDPMDCTVHGIPRPEYWSG